MPGLLAPLYLGWVVVLATRTFHFPGNAQAWTHSQLPAWHTEPPASWQLKATGLGSVLPRPWRGAAACLVLTAEACLLLGRPLPLERVAGEAGTSCAPTWTCSERALRQGPTVTMRRNSPLPGYMLNSLGTLEPVAGGLLCVAEE